MAAYAPPCPVHSGPTPSAARSRRPLMLAFPSGPRTFPSIQIGRYTIWGLTERILAEFAAVTGL